MSGPIVTPDPPADHGDPGPEHTAKDRKVHQAELAISLVLRVGVGVAVALVLVGMVVVFIHQAGHGGVVRNGSYKAYTSAGTPFPHSIAGLRQALARGDGQGFIELGLVVLILTPILRVVVGAIAFFYEDDLPMALITLFVLAVLVASFVIGGAA